MFIYVYITLIVCCVFCLYVGSPWNQKSPETTGLRCDMVFVCLKRKMSWWSELVQKIAHVFWSSEICLREKTRWLDWSRSGVCRFTVREKVATFRKSSIIGGAWLVSAPPKKDWNKVLCVFDSNHPWFLAVHTTYYLLVTRLCEYMSFESSFSWGIYTCVSAFLLHWALNRMFPLIGGINNLVQIDFFPEFHLEIGEWSLQETVGLTSFGFWVDNS